MRAKNECGAPFRCASKRLPDVGIRSADKERAMKVGPTEKADEKLTYQISDLLQKLQQGTHRAVGVLLDVIDKTV